MSIKMRLHGHVSGEKGDRGFTGVKGNPGLHGLPGQCCFW